MNYAPYINVLFESFCPVFQGIDLNNILCKADHVKNGFEFAMKAIHRVLPSFSFSTATVPFDYKNNLVEKLNQTLHSTKVSIVLVEPALCILVTYFKVFHQFYVSQMGKFSSAAVSETKLYTSLTLIGVITSFWCSDVRAANSMGKGAA